MSDRESAAGRLVTVVIDAVDVPHHPGLLARTHDGDVDAIIVRRVYEPAYLAGLVEQIIARRVRFPEFPIPPAGAGVVLGGSLDLVPGSVDEHLEDARLTRSALRELFAGGVDFEERSAEILGHLAGVPARVLEHADGRGYSPATVRYLGPGAGIRMHCEDQKLGEPAKARIAEVARPRVSSFYMTMVPPASGGELLLYDLTWAAVRQEHLERGRIRPDRVASSHRADRHALAAGDMVLFGKGRVHEVTPVGPGTARWTIGGFFVFARDDSAVYFYS